jgi:hypothetical protein
MESIEQWTEEYLILRSTARRQIFDDPMKLRR